MPHKAVVSGFISKNVDLMSILSIDIAMSLSDIDLFAKALTSIFVMLIALRRWAKRNDDKKDVEQIRAEVREEIEKELKDNLKEKK